MAFPAIQKFTAAGMLLNQTITFVSLLTTIGTYITGITNQAIAKGYTIAGSSNGTTAAMDGVNRCTTAAGFAIQAANTTTAQSWIVITAANGAQTCFAFVGATNDIARISCSPGGLFVVAGTATFTPTATDEVVGITGVSLIGSTASGNRVFNVQIDSAHNGWRAFIFRASVLVAPLLWCELYDPAFVISPAVVSVPVWCGTLLAANTNALQNAVNAFSANAVGGVTRMTISSVATTVNMGGSCKLLGGNTGAAENNIAQELNGSAFITRALGLSSVTATARGDVGNRYDWHYSQDFQPCGALDAAKNWVMLNTAAAAGTNGGVLWTWDSTIATVTTA